MLCSFSCIWGIRPLRIFNATSFPSISVFLEQAKLWSWFRCPKFINYNIFIVVVEFVSDVRRMINPARNGSGLQSRHFVWIIETLRPVQGLTAEENDLDRCVMGIGQLNGLRSTELSSSSSI